MEGNDRCKHCDVTQKIKGQATTANITMLRAYCIRLHARCFHCKTLIYVHLFNSRFSDHFFSLIFYGRSLSTGHCPISVYADTVYFSHAMSNLCMQFAGSFAEEHFSLINLDRSTLSFLGNKFCFYIPHHKIELIQDMTHKFM